MRLIQTDKVATVCGRSKTLWGEGQEKLSPGVVAVVPRRSRLLVVPPGKRWSVGKSLIGISLCLSRLKRAEISA